MSNLEDEARECAEKLGGKVAEVINTLLEERGELLSALECYYDEDCDCFCCETFRKADSR